MKDIIFFKNQIFDISAIEHVSFAYEKETLNSHYIDMDLVLSCGLKIRMNSKESTTIIVKIMIYVGLFSEEEDFIYANKEIFYELFSKKYHKNIDTENALKIFTSYYSIIKKTFQLKS